MRKLFTFTRAQRRRTAQRWLLASFVMGAAAVILPSLAITAIGPSPKAAPTPPLEIEQPLALTRAAAHIDCSDFDNQWEAQAFLQSHGKAGQHRLDDDRNGIACERLP